MSGGLLSSMLSGRFRKKLLKVLQKIRGSVEQTGNLGVDVLNGL
jgi:hypothetical protein